MAAMEARALVAICALFGCGGADSTSTDRTRDTTDASADRAGDLVGDRIPGDQAADSTRDAGSPVGPTPDGDDRILFDTRTSLQVAGTTEVALALFDEVTGSWSLATDVDGRGTHALRLDHPGWDGVNCTDQGGMLYQQLPSPSPRQLFVQWRLHLGRTTTGEGLGPVGSFQITNVGCGNAGAKRMLVLRDVPDLGGEGRVDYVWSGPAPVNERLEGWYTSPNPGNLGQNAGPEFSAEASVGADVTHTLYLEAASTSGASDGAARMWINGALVMEHINIPTGHWAFHRFQFPTTFRAPAQAQSEYYWDILVWEPVP